MTRAAALGWLARLLTAAGLGVDAGMHAYLAPSQPPGGAISQVGLFYIEAAVASVAAVLVLATAARMAYAFAFSGRRQRAGRGGALPLRRYRHLGSAAGHV